MLKVLINEEEVLTNKNFTIKKEMLNTPSVILNNVYPKTWEDSKDYTSNFYHPQDYSKCKIIDETIVPADPGETITGTSFTIQDYDSTKLVELTEIEGNTTQSGTPTPSSPQPINVVSGRQEVVVASKNYFNPTKEWSNDGVDCTIDNQKITFNGTSTAGRTYETVNTPIPSGTYKISLEVLNETFTPQIIWFDFFKGNTKVAYLSITGTGSTNLSLPNGADTIKLGFDNNKTFDNYTFRVQIEAGNQATNWVAYEKTNTEINLGKNLVDFDNPSGVYNCTYDTTTKIYTTSVLTGDFVGINIWTANTPLVIPTGTSTFYYSADIKLASGTYNDKINLFREGQGYTGLTRVQTNISNPIISNEYQRYIFKFDYTNTSGNFISSSNNFIQLTRGASNAVLEIKNVMISKSDTTYAPYKTPIELCKIGTYQDRIYKENGTWYLHKEIGKVVLDGSESWQDVGTDRFNIVGITTNYLKKDGATTYICNNYQAFNQTISNSSFNNLVSNVSYGFNMNSSTGFDIRFKHTGIDNVNDFKIWLSTHNTIVYYVLATPTTEEITDTELINQLNAIELLEGLNNVSVSSADLPGEITIHYNYTEEQTIDDLLFCGVVKNSGNISLNPREPHFQSLQILDFKTFLSEGELDSFVIYQKTILEAIQMVIANIQDYGFILGNVNILNPTEIIGAYSTKDKTAYDVFNYIADITQSRWTTRLIDENHVAIDFYDPTLMIEGTPINYTQTFFENNLIDDMTYSYGSNNYRNKQVMTSSQVYSNISQQQSIVANGYQTQFPTEQPIGKINSITSNGIPLTFATFNEKEMGYVADFYYSPGDNHFESEDLRTTGEILIIDYVAIVEGRQIITNPLEIDRISDSTGRKGIISRYEQRNDATTSTELQKIGESYIKYKGTPEIKLKISTRKNIWEVGQRVQFNAPIEELDTEYMVRTKKINYIATIDTIFYEYELISSFNSETEINYFDNQRAKASGNIGEGEYISRNIDIESTANIIFYDTETTEVQVDGDNELNSILNSPFIS